jgi:hypothetical protein
MNFNGLSFLDYLYYRVSTAYGTGNATNNTPDRVRGFIVWCSCISSNVYFLIFVALRGLGAEKYLEASYSEFQSIVIYGVLGLVGILCFLTLRPRHQEIFDCFSKEPAISRKRRGMAVIVYAVFVTLLLRL